MNSKNIVIGLLLLIAVAGAIWGIGKVAPQGASIGGVAAKDEVVIGAILPLTGDMSFLGMQMQRGMELALADYPEANLHIVYEDNKTVDNTAAVNALNKLVSVDGADIVLNDVVNTVKALAPILNREQVPAVVFWDSNELISTISPYVFGMGFSTERAGSDMANFAFEELNVRTVYIVSAQDEWSDIISGSFVSALTDHGGIVVAHEKFAPDYTDFRTSIAKARQAKVDALYFPVFPQAAESLIRQARELGYDGDLLSGDGFIGENVVGLGSLAEGVYATKTYLKDEAFSKKYKAAYGEQLDALDLPFAGLGYDAVRLVANVVKELRAKNIPVTAESIRDALPGRAFEGVTGDGQLSLEGTADKRESILVVRGGVFELVR